MENEIFLFKYFHFVSLVFTRESLKLVSYPIGQIPAINIFTINCYEKNVAEVSLSKHLNSSFNFIMISNPVLIENFTKLHHCKIFGAPQRVKVGAGGNIE